VNVKLPTASPRLNFGKTSHSGPKAASKATITQIQGQTSRNDSIVMRAFSRFAPRTIRDEAPSSGVKLHSDFYEMC